MNPLVRVLQRMVASKPGTWVYLNVFPFLDRPLLRLSRGRLSMSVGQPVCLLETVGARSGEPRSNPLVYTADGEDLLLVASNGGGPRNPAWYWNARANPEVRVTVGGRTGRYLARELEGEEREEAWRKCTEAYLGFEVYRRRAGQRRIPLLRLRSL